MMTSRLASTMSSTSFKKSLRKCSPIRSMTYVAASVRSVGLRPRGSQVTISRPESTGEWEQAPRRPT